MYWLASCAWVGSCWRSPATSIFRNPSCPRPRRLAGGARRWCCVAEAAVVLADGLGHGGSGLDVDEDAGGRAAAGEVSSRSCVVHRRQRWRCARAPVGGRVVAALLRRAAVVARRWTISTAATSDAAGLERRLSSCPPLRAPRRASGRSALMRATSPSRGRAQAHVDVRRARRGAAAAGRGRRRVVARRTRSWSCSTRGARCGVVASAGAGAGAAARCRRRAAAPASPGRGQGVAGVGARVGDAGDGRARAHRRQLTGRRLAPRHARARRRVAAAGSRARSARSRSAGGGRRGRRGRADRCGCCTGRRRAAVSALRVDARRRARGAAQRPAQRGWRRRRAGPAAGRPARRPRRRRAVASGRSPHVDCAAVDSAGESTLAAAGAAGASAVGEGEGASGNGGPGGGVPRAASAKPRRTLGVPGVWSAGVGGRRSQRGPGRSRGPGPDPVGWLGGRAPSTTGGGGHLQCRGRRHQRRPPRRRSRGPSRRSSRLGVGRHAAVLGDRARAGVVGGQRLVSSPPKRSSSGRGTARRRRSTGPDRAGR